MGARMVRIQPKPKSIAAFTRPLEHDIFPLRRPPPGFQDAMTFGVPGGTDAVRMRVWDQQVNAEVEARGTSPHVLQAVAHVVARTPQVHTSAVPHAICPTIAAHVAA